MKILLVGSNFSYAIERYFVRYLTEMGVEINQYTAPDIVFNYHSKNLFNKVLFRTKINTGYKPVNRELVKIAHEYKPDVIWVFKGMELFPETLATLNKDFRLANYNPDHPFLITSRGSGNSNVRDSVGLYQLHFCYHNQLIQQIKNEFHIPAVFLPFAYDNSDMQYMDQNSLTEINKLCFQANPDAYRVDMIEKLAENGLEVDVFGIGWQKTKLRNNPRVRLFNIADRKEFWKLNQEYRVQLNLFREYNKGSHNMRTFEIPAVGGIQLAPYSEEQAMFFKEGEEIFFFHNETEMVEKAKFLLSLPAHKALEIRNAARKRSLNSGYTFKDRAITVYKSFKALVDGCIIEQQ